MKAHILDYAIKHACTSYKGALTNYLEGNINGFKVKHWKTNRSKKIMEIEPSFIKNGNEIQRSKEWLDRLYVEAIKSDKIAL